jgi:flagellar hook-associated protein 1 FlgK
MDADAEIARQVEQVNAALKRVESLNRQIREAVSTGRDPTALEDERDRQIDVINGIVPIRAQPRSDGGVTLVSQGGAVLLEERAQQLSFTPTSVITPDLTREGGGLSGVTLYGRDATPPGGSGLLGGGALEAAFRTRDVDIPEFSAQLDALALDLIERFQDPASDPTIAAPATAGLFVDRDAPLVAVDAVGAPATQVGLAGRIMLSAAVDPLKGGEAWRMRDGVNAAAPGDAGSSAIARARVDAFAAPRAAAAPVRADDPTRTWGGPAFGVARSASELVEAVASIREQRMAQAEQTAAFARASAVTLRDAEMRVTGVDTDQELQNLLALEKSYAANAKVLSVIDTLLNRILEI